MHFELLNIKDISICFNLRCISGILYKYYLLYDYVFCCDPKFIHTTVTSLWPRDPAVTRWRHRGGNLAVAAAVRDPSAGRIA